MIPLEKQTNSVEREAANLILAVRCVKMHAEDFVPLLITHVGSKASTPGSPTHGLQRSVFDPPQQVDRYLDELIPKVAAQPKSSRSTK
jgi:hypothetical protein